MSEPTPPLDREALRQQLLAEFDQAVNAVADSIDAARDGHWIDDSEEVSRLALDRFRQQIYQAAMQAKIDAAEAAFPPSEEREERSADAS